MTEIKKDREYYFSLREQVNKMFTELQQKPEEYKMPFSLTAGSILNAYREGDISFNEAVKYLEESKDYRIERLKSTVADLKGQIDRL